MSTNNKGLDDLEGMSEYQVGSWRSPYVKVYSIGGKNRIAEISNYPRAYKDTTPHVYTEDTPFIVTESDLNHVVDEERVYRDYREKLFRVGEEALSAMREHLPTGRIIQGRKPPDEDKQVLRILYRRVF